MMKLIYHFCTVAVLILVIFGNCVISQKTVAVAGSDQQKVLSSTATTTTVTTTTNTTTTTIKPILITSSLSATTNTTTSAKSVSSRNRNATGETLKITESTEDEVESSAEILSDTGDVARSSITPTTYRPARPSIAPHTSAQERERKLMNVLAARRTALQRGIYRTRVGTTGRTAIATASIETTPKTPTDPRSICIRNCTKNFTRRTTASCMRQCTNFHRNNSNINGTTIVVKAGSKTGLGTQSERDTNEILFTDESSHGLFVVAKDQNATLNHIPEAGVKGVGGTSAGYKFRSRGKPAAVNGAVTGATTSIEDDDIAPYLYFGQKLPPIRPATLTITSVSDEHPKLLEVSVASSTPPSISASAQMTSTLSPVERSRSRYKYNMRDRGNLPFNRRFSGTLGPRQALLNPSENSTDIKTEAALLMSNVTTTTTTTTEQPDKQFVAEKLVLEESIAEKLPPEDAAANFTIPTSTPLIITVLSDEEEVTEMPKEIKTKQEEMQIKTTTASVVTTSIISTTTATTAATATATPSVSTTAKAANTTIKTTTSPTTEPQPIQSSSTSRSTTTTTTPSPPPPSTTPSTTSTTASTTTTTTSTTALPRTKSIIEEDTERLRALGPSLTQQINTDEKTNLIIFINRTTGIHIPDQDNQPNSLPHPHSTTIRPPFAPFEPVLDPASTILHTSVLTSVRSTVHPRTSTDLPSDYVATALTDIAGGVQRSTSATTTTALASDISSTIVADEREVTIEMRRINMATYVLAGIGIFPLIAVIAYVMRNIIMRRSIKADEVFDVCITDQQPISPVKKLDSKYSHDKHEDDEVDHHQLHHHHQNHHPPLHKQHSSPHQQQKQQQRDVNFNIKSVSNNISSNNMITSGRYDEHCSVTSDQEFDRNNIRLKSLLGEGNFGQVWKAEADDLSGHFGATRIVAVKTVRACSAQVGLKDEANIMRKLGSHQNVVILLGACVESEPHMLIMEYAMRGRLLSLLRAARSATNILPASVPGGRSLAPLSPRTLAGFALDIACGMEYIAERRIVHRDLAARNVLLDHNGVCKICDFGMSIDLDAEQEVKTLQKKHKKEEEAKNCANEIMRSNSHKFKFDFGGRFIMNHWSNSFGNHNNAQHKDSNEKKSSGHSPDTISRRPALPIRWMAPEALQYHVFTTETDIWAFGIVLWEIATLGSTPYSHLTGREVIRNVPNGLRPDLPKEGRHEFYKLMARCWHKEPLMRPSFTHSRMEISRSLGKWVEDDSAASDYMDVSGFSEDLEHGMVYFNHRISEFECEI